MAGNIAKRPDGRWRARYRDEGGKEHARHFVRKIDAQRWLDEVTTSLVTGTYADPKAGRITFAAYFKEWSERQIWVPGTRKAMALAAGSVTFPTVPMKSIRRSHIETWVRSMNASGLAPGTITTRFNNVRSVFRSAHRDRVIGDDPTSGISLPRRRRAEHAMTIPTTEVVGRLMGTADEQFVAFIGLCAFAGLRLGEAAALKVDDIDFLGRTLTVRRQVQRAGGKEVEIRAPKYGSERTVYIADGLVTLLSQHIAIVGHQPAGWLFKGQENNPPHQNTVAYFWRKTKRDAGIDNLRLHDLRHFFASGLIAAGCDVVTVQRALGHTSATTTLNTYSHLWPTAEDRTRKAANSMLTAALNARNSASEKSVVADRVAD